MSIAVHLRLNPDCYRVDRATALGNPWDLGSEAQRPTVIRAHKEYLWLIVAHGYEPVTAVEEVSRRYPELRLSPKWRRPSRASFMAALNEAQRSEKLGCWCAPKPCHADNYVGYFKYLEKGNVDLA